MADVDHLGEGRGALEGGVDVALHLRQRQRRRREGAVGAGDAVPRVLPALVGEPARVASAVVDEAVPVGVAGSGDPVDGAADGRRQALERRLVDRPPPPRLGGQADEERGGVDGAVVAAPGRERAAAAVPAQLVEDPTGLLLRGRVVLAALEVGEAGQHPSGEGAVEGQGHPRGQQRVASEERHEPRRTGSHDRPFGVLPVDDAQGGQVGQRLVDRGGQPRVEGDHRRDRRTPRGQVPDRHAAGQPRGALEVCGYAGRHRLHLDGDGELVVAADAQTPARGAGGRVGLVRRRAP